MLEFISRSAEETMEWGRQFGKQIPLGTVLCFFGELAAGKTTLLKGIIQGAANIEPSEIQSPTFTYLNIYEGDKRIHHFDLYRLTDGEQFVSMGFEEYFDPNAICCIEWPERILDYLPSNYIKVLLEHKGENLRKIRVENEEIFAS